MNDNDNPNPELIPPPPLLPFRTLSRVLRIWYHDREYPDIIMLGAKRVNIIGCVVLAYDVYEGDVTTTHYIPLTSIEKYTITEHWD